MVSFAFGFVNSFGDINSIWWIFTNDGIRGILTRDVQKRRDGNYCNKLYSVGNYLSTDSIAIGISLQDCV